MTPRPRKKPTPVAKPSVEAENTDEERTEIVGEYRGGKIRFLIGKQGYTVGLAVSFLLFCMGASILVAMVVNAIIKLKGQ
jgi:hypothetical protein